MRPEKLLPDNKSSKIKEIEGQLKSGIMLEISVLTSVPIKGPYSLTYKVGYGRNESKWVEQLQNVYNKSRNLTLEYTFGTLK